MDLYSIVTLKCYTRSLNDVKNFNFSDGVITFRYYNYAVFNFIIRCGLCRRVERLDRKRELPWKEYHE
jgi:hypothetical protein